MHESARRQVQVANLLTCEQFTWALIHTDTCDRYETSNKTSNIPAGLENPPVSHNIAVLLQPYTCMYTTFHMHWGCSDATAIA